MSSIFSSVGTAILNLAGVGGAGEPDQKKKKKVVKCVGVCVPPATNSQY
jgi:hypothetical protein